MTPTRWFLMLWVAAALLWDAWALWRWGVGGTISIELHEAARERPAVAVMVGCVVGHVFFTRPGGGP